MDISRKDRGQIIADFYDELKLKRIEEPSEFEEVFSDILLLVYKHTYPLDFRVSISRETALSIFIIMNDRVSVYIEWENNKETILSIANKFDVEQGSITTQSFKDTLYKIEKLCMIKTPLN